MNERIRELFKREYGYPPSPGELVEAEKFAELIVKECVSIVADAVNHREPASTYVGKIKEHFGVDE